MENDIVPPAWDPGDAYRSVLDARRFATARAAERVSWYKKKCSTYGRGARLIRISCILLTGLGGLCQLIEVTKPLGYVFISVNLTTWSYTAFALVAGLFALDKYFGLSSGWIRFMTTQLALERSAVEFDYDFILIASQMREGSLPPALAAAILQRVKDFALQVEVLVKQETDAWAVEFQNSIAELEKITKTELEKAKPGSIKVIVSKPEDLELVEICKNGVSVSSLSGKGESLIPNLAPGPYAISATARRKDGSSLRAEKVVEVQAGKMEPAELNFS
jgi:hypothetical protein